LRRNRSRAPVRLAPLLTLCSIGTLSHPALDYLNDYGLRPWLPFSATRYYGDLLTIVDPWLWVVFAPALLLVARSRKGRAAWLGLILLLCALVLAGAGGWLASIWAAVLGSVLVLVSFLHRRGILPARASLVLFSLYLAGVAAIREGAARSARAAASSAIEVPIRHVDILPARPGRFLRWTVVVETDTRYYLAERGPWDRTSRRPDFRWYAKNWDEPCFQAALSEDSVAVMSRFARFPSVEVRREGRHCTVFLRDLRYARDAITGWGTASAVVKATGKGSPEPIAPAGRPE